jgi:hypothetical protein
MEGHSFFILTQSLLQGEAVSFASEIARMAEEKGVTYSPRALNLLDGIVCHYSFVVIGLAQTMREVPSQSDYEYCLSVLGFTFSCEATQTANLTTFWASHLMHFLSNIIQRSSCISDCMITDEVVVSNVVSESDLHNVLYDAHKKTFLFQNSEFRRTNSAYIGPWKLYNGGRGNCLFYSFRQLISIWKVQRKIDSGSKAYCTLWPQQTECKSPEDLREYKKQCSKMEEDSEKLRESSSNYFLNDLTSLMPGNHKVSFMQDTQVVERPMTKADFIYMAKEGDLKLEPDFQEERIAWAKKWCVRAKEKGEWGCMRMITGFANLIREPRSIALYFFNVNERERTRSLDRTEEQSIQPLGAPEVVSRENDGILKLPQKRMEDDIRVLRSGELQKKTLGLRVKQGTLEQWHSPRAPLQRHCALYHESGRHWCVLVSAIQMEELRKFSNIDEVAKPLFS